MDAVSTILEDTNMAPDLCFTYLPSLDYDLQRKDPENSPANLKARAIANRQLSRLVETAGFRGYDVLVFGDYHVGPVRGAVLPNLALRKAGLMAVRTVKGKTYPDFHTSRAFAMVDHEIAHVYIPKDQDIPAVKELLANLPGISEILGRESADRHPAVPQK